MSGVVTLATLSSPLFVGGPVEVVGARLSRRRRDSGGS